MSRRSKIAAKARRIQKRRDAKQRRRAGVIEMQECLHAELQFAMSVREATEAVYDRYLNDMIMGAAL